MPRYTMRDNPNPSLAGVLFGLLVSLTIFVYSVYFFYRIAVTIHAWPFG